jgi:TM2 domain-containing membrane protein YozV
MAQDTPPSSRKKHSRFVAAAWAIFGGGFGCHRFYLRQPLWALLYILVSCVGAYLLVKACCALSPNDLINMLSTNRLPDSVTKSRDYVVSMYLMGIPMIVGIVEGIIYLLTPKEKFDKRYNP